MNRRKFLLGTAGLAVSAKAGAEVAQKFVHKELSVFVPMKKGFYPASITEHPEVLAAQLKQNVFTRELIEMKFDPPLEVPALSDKSLESKDYLLRTGCPILTKTP